MQPRQLLRRLLYLVVIGYVLFCVGIYFMQRTLLFPAYAALPVGDNWQPTVGALHEQTMLDGQCGKLHAVLWRIAGDKGTVLVFHGNGESVANVEGEVAMFHELGYSVMAWDYPGYGRSTPCWFTESDLLQDAETAYLWLKQKTPDSRIVLYGHSVGTGLALYVASRHPNHRVLLVSPYDALVNVAQDHMPWLVPVNLLIRYPLHADRWIGRVHGSIHALHGLADTLIAPQHAVALLHHANGNADIEWVVGANHNDLSHAENNRRWLASKLLTQ